MAFGFGSQQLISTFSKTSYILCLRLQVRCDTRPWVPVSVSVRDGKGIDHVSRCGLNFASASLAITSQRCALKVITAGTTHRYRESSNDVVCVLDRTLLERPGILQDGGKECSVRALLSDGIIALVRPEDEPGTCIYERGTRPSSTTPSSTPQSPVSMFLWES